MHRNVLALIAAGLLLLSPMGKALAADAGGDVNNKELEKFQGTWLMVSGEMGGKKASDEHVKKGKIVYEGKKFTLTVPNQTPETIVAEIVKLDPTKNPKEMHLVRKNGPSAGKTLVGIYAFRGDDQYDFALDPSGKTTLKEFATKEGTGHVRNLWKRVKP